MAVQRFSFVWSIEWWCKLTSVQSSFCRTPNRLFPTFPSGLMITFCFMLLTSIYVTIDSSPFVRSRKCYYLSFSPTPWTIHHFGTLKTTKFTRLQYPFCIRPHTRHAALACFDGHSLSASKSQRIHISSLSNQPINLHATQHIYKPKISQTMCSFELESLRTSYCQCQCQCNHHHHQPLPPF